MSAKMIKREKLSITLEPYTKRKLIELAKADNRSISNYIETVILKEIASKKAGHG